MAYRGLPTRVGQRSPQCRSLKEPQGAGHQDVGTPGTSLVGGLREQCPPNTRGFPQSIRAQKVPTLPYSQVKKLRKPGEVLGEGQLWVSGAWRQAEVTAQRECKVTTDLWLQNEHTQAATLMSSASVIHVCSIPHCQQDLFLCFLLGWHHLKPSSLQCLEHPARTGDLIKASNCTHSGHAILGTTREVVIYLFPHLTYRLVPERVSGSAERSTGIPPRVRVTSKQHTGPCNCSWLSPEPLCRRARHLTASTRP